jgi:hypothetical protein
MNRTTKVLVLGCEWKESVGNGGVCGDTGVLFVIVEVPEALSPKSSPLRLCLGMRGSSGEKRVNWGGNW